MRIGKIAKRLAACVRAVDTSRPVTGALAGVVMSNQTEYPEAIDVVGYNYTENRYDEDHATYPNRVIYGSENGSGLEAWYAVKDKEFIFGQFIWTGTDYLGESGAWPSRGLYTGLLDFGSFPDVWCRSICCSLHPLVTWKSKSCPHQYYSVYSCIFIVVDRYLHAILFVRPTGSTSFGRFRAFDAVISGFIKYVTYAIHVGTQGTDRPV